MKLFNQILNGFGIYIYYRIFMIIYILMIFSIIPIMFLIVIMFYIFNKIYDSQILKLIVFLAFLLLTSLFYSCDKGRIEYEFKQTIIKAKTIELKDGDTRYNIAFTDGSSEYFNFGLYSYYEVGDTICWRREKNWFWYVINCD